MPLAMEIDIDCSTEESGQGLSVGHSTIAALACERCKRRKIKCDKRLPSCGVCFKASNTCSYPLTAQKPGPKSGQVRPTFLDWGQSSRFISSHSSLLSYCLIPLPHSACNKEKELKLENKAMLTQGRLDRSIDELAIAMEERTSTNARNQELGLVLLEVPLHSVQIMEPVKDKRNSSSRVHHKRTCSLMNRKITAVPVPELSIPTYHPQLQRHPNLQYLEA
jgi:hypothetical protein